MIRDSKNVEAELEKAKLGCQVNAHHDANQGFAYYYAKFQKLKDELACIDANEKENSK